MPRMTRLGEMNASEAALRLNRYLARAGFGSRRAVEELVRAGRVACNGQVVHDLGRRIGQVAIKHVVMRDHLRQARNARQRGAEAAQFLLHVHRRQVAAHPQLAELVAARADLMRELRGFLPDDAVLEQEEELRPYECDGLSAYRQLPLLVVLPRTLEEVQRIMRLCNDRDVPVVARDNHQPRVRRPAEFTTLRGVALFVPDTVLVPKTLFQVDASRFTHDSTPDSS